jgi:hypothetical protein
VPESLIGSHKCADCGKVHAGSEVGPVEWWITEIQCSACYTKELRSRDEAYRSVLKKLTLEEIRVLGLTIR